MSLSVASLDGLVTLTQPDAPAAEEFRRLRTNIQFADVERPLRTVGLCAAQAGSGKSTIVANLAVAFAQAGKQVILVDADLLNPVQHAIFGVPNAAGLVDVLAGETSLEETLLATVASGVRLLPAGSPAANPAQVLNGSRTEALLNRLLEFADLILVDTPALAELADSALFAGKLDGVVLVVERGHSRREDVRAARELLERVHARVLGAALNHGQQQGGLWRKLFGGG